MTRSRYRRRRTARAPGRLAVALVACALLGAAAFGAVLGTVAAGDQLATVSPSPEAVAASPGEEVEVDVLMRSNGGHAGEGVVSVALVAQYHPDYLEVVAVEAGPWLAGDGTEVRAEATVAHEAGTVVLDQRREPPAGGATGEDRLATLTVAVAEDAPPSTATVSFAETAVELEGDWPLPVYDRDLAVEIDGGGEPAGTFDHPDPDAVDGETRRVDGPADDGGDADRIAGLPLTAAALAVATALVLALAARRRS
ncbi:cellulosome anchor protein [Salinilacihabitans rarus]|uniref:cellulosome anchor protein n=1 Tax=Salinilacihabitans rarus TaxID=2961596 RepID=UPI0020C89FE1|nr:cellulosome anchor protein [Salinilacihabitans rarus]